MTATVFITLAASHPRPSHVEGDYQSEHGTVKHSATTLKRSDVTPARVASLCSSVQAFKCRLCSHLAPSVSAMAQHIESIHGAHSPNTHTSANTTTSRSACDSVGDAVVTTPVFHNGSQPLDQCVASSAAHSSPLNYTDADDDESVTVVQVSTDAASSVGLPPATATAATTKTTGESDHASARCMFVCGVCAETFTSHALSKQHVNSAHATPAVDEKHATATRRLLLAAKDVEAAVDVNDDVVTTVAEQCDSVEGSRSPPHDWAVAERRLPCRQAGCDVRLSCEASRQLHELCHTRPSQSDASVSHRADESDSDGGGRLYCPHCRLLDNVDALSWPRLATHLWRAHGSDVDLYRCERCAFRCSLSANLLKHRRRRHGRPAATAAAAASVDRLPRRLRQQLCEPCGRVFSSRAALAQHRRCRHDNVRVHCCTVCNHTAGTRHLLQLHMRGHGNQRPHKCPSAGCTFSSRDPSSLKKHQMRHTGVRPYRCTECSYSCIQTAALKAHYRQHHSGCEGGLWRCQLCAFSTVNKHLYSQHLTDHDVGLVRKVQLGASTGVADSTSGGALVAASGAEGSTVARGGVGAHLRTSRTADSVADGRGSSLDAGQYVFQIVPDKPTEDRGGVSIPAGEEHGALLSDILGEKQ